MIAFDPTLVRKAAAFVEAIEEIEGRFGIRLGASAPIFFRAREWEQPLALIRVPGDEARLSLALAEEPAAGPRFPIPGRD